MTRPAPPLGAFGGNAATYHVPAWRLMTLLVATCLLRPTLFGQELSWIGLVLILVVLVSHVLNRAMNSMIVSQSRFQAMQGLWFLTALQIIFWLYSLMVAVLQGDSNFGYVLKAVVGGITTAVAFNVVLADQDGNYYFFGRLARLQAMLGYSIAITVLLLQFVDRQQLMIVNFAIAGYEEFEGGNGDLLFPVSFFYGELSEYGIYRFLGIYRETGIAQFFFVWATAFLSYSKAAWSWRVGALLGALLCGSTAVAMSLAAVVFLNMLLSDKKNLAQIAFGVVLLVVTVLALLYAPGLGLEDKQQTHGASLDDRSASFDYVLNSGKGLLFGNGIYYEKYLPLPVGINAVSSVFYYGVIGLILILAWFLCVPINAVKIRRQYLVSIAPLLLTALVSQPLIDAPSALLLLYCTTYCGADPDYSSESI